MSVLIVTLPGHTHTTTACPVPPPLHHLSHSQKGLPWNSHSRGAGGGGAGQGHGGLLVTKAAPLAHHQPQQPCDHSLPAG